jgi:hypothetical protein
LHCLLAWSACAAAAAQPPTSRATPVLDLHEIGDVLALARQRENAPLGGGPQPREDYAVKLVAAVQALVTPAFDEERHRLLVASEPAVTRAPLAPLTSTPGGSATSVLVAELERAQQRWLAEFLDRQRATENVTLDVRAWLLEVPADRAGELGGGPLVLRGEQRLAAFWKRIDAPARLGDVELGDEELRLRPLQLHRFTKNVRPIDYVQDFHVHRDVVAGEKLMAVPVVGTLRDGLEVLAWPLLLAGDRAGVLVELRENLVEKPIPEFTTTLALDPRKLTLALPTVRARNAHAAAALAAGDALAFALPERDGRVVVAVVALAGLRRD